MVVPELDPGPAAYAWAHEFTFVGGNGGWLGLQSGGAGGDGKAAVLSVRGAVSADAGGAAAASGTGGWSCTLAWPWEAGRAYWMRVWTEVEGWWSAEVGEEGGEPALIGHIQVPGGWRRLASRSLVSTEYRGPALARCADLASSRVIFSVPTADGSEVTPVRHESHLGPGTCESSRVEDLSTGGVRHEMGGPP